MAYIFDHDPSWAPFHRESELCLQNWKPLQRACPKLSIRTQPNLFSLAELAGPTGMDSFGWEAGHVKGTGNSPGCGLDLARWVVLAPRAEALEMDRWLHPLGVALPHFSVRMSYQSSLQLKPCKGISTARTGAALRGLRLRSSYSLSLMDVVSFFTQGFPQPSAIPLSTIRARRGQLLATPGSWCTVPSPPAGGRGQKALQGDSGPNYS